MTNEQAIQAINEITNVAFQAQVSGPVHVRCQALNKELLNWINSQDKGKDSDGKTEHRNSKAVASRIKK